MYYSKCEIIFSKIPSILFWSIATLLSVFLGFVSFIYPFIGLIIFCIFVIIVPLLIKPEYAMYVFVVLPTFSAAIVVFFGEGILLKIAHLGAIVLLFSWCIARLSNNRKYIPDILSQHGIYYIAFFMWASFSLLWSYEKMHGLNQLILLFLALSTLYISANVLTNKKTLYVTFLLIISIGFINALFSLLFPYFSSFIHIQSNITENISCLVHIWAYHTKGVLGRTQGLAEGPHQTAAFMVMPIAVSLMLFLVTHSKKKRRVFFALALIMFAGMISTLSKTPVFSFLIGVAYVMFHIKPLKRFFLTNMLKVLILMIILFCLVRINDLTGSFGGYLRDMEVVSSSQDVTSLGNRLGILKVGLETLLQTDGFGCGIGSFRPIAKAHGITIDCAHQLVLFELGFVGLMLWLLILVFAYLLFIKTIENTTDEYYRRMLIVYTGGYVSIIAMWLFTTSYTEIYLWFYMGFGYALVHMSKKYPMKEVPLPFYESGATIVDI